MSFYTHFHNRGDAIFLRWIDEQGRRRSTVVKDFQPTLYVKTNEETKYQTLEGFYLKPVQTESISDAKRFIEEYSDVEGFEAYGNTNWDYSYINQRWEQDIKYDESLILTYYLDIETEVSDEFPDPNLAKERINVLTIFDGTKFHCWCFQDARPKMKHPFPVELKVFSDEDSMLRNFVAFWTGNYPDVVTGWNTERFDIIYLLNRIRQRLGEDKMKSLSPVGLIREYNIDQKSTSFEIKGIEHLDYLQLFKKYMPGERDFSLDAVCEDFLGEQKLENPYSTFREFYEKSWDLFVDYNIHDVSLVHKLEQKLKLLSLTFSIAYLVKMNYSDVFGTVKPWDIFIQNSLYKENKFVRCKTSPGVADRQIMGGFVMTPVPGRYEWVVSFDANSLYPSIIRTWNISPETILSEHEVPDELIKYYDKIQVDEMLKDTSELAALLKKYNLTMTANGHFFRRDKQGIMPLLTGMVYNGRVDAKNEMKKYKKALVNETDPAKREDFEARIASLDNKQLALKILLNSLYGAMANAYFRFFDFRCAEGITSTGQFFIQKVGQMASSYIDKMSGVEDSLVYIDTDSNYFSLKSLVKRAGLDKLPTAKLVDALDKMCEEKIGKKIDEACKWIGDELNVFDNQLAVKREKICESAIWVAKKRYALYVWDNEGVRYKEADIAVTGLEVKRSNTPKICRDALNDALRIFLIGTEQELQDFVKQTREKFFKQEPYTIAMPSGVKGLYKYSDAKTIYKQGCPQHVRASLLYNHFLKTHGIAGNYNPIMEGGKMRRVPLRMPNPIGEDVIGFVDKLPEEFGLHEYVDYEELFQKTFMGALERIAGAVRWQVEKKVTLDDFFC